MPSRAGFRPRLAEVAPVEAALAPDLHEQLLDFIAWPNSAYSKSNGSAGPSATLGIGWACHRSTNRTSAKFHGKLLRGLRLPVVRVNFDLQRTGGTARLGNRQPQRCFPPRIGRALAPRRSSPLSFRMTLPCTTERQVTASGVHSARACARSETTPPCPRQSSDPWRAASFPQSSRDWDDVDGPRLLDLAVLRRQQARALLKSGSFSEWRRYLDVVEDCALRTSRGSTPSAIASAVALPRINGSTDLRPATMFSIFSSMASQSTGSSKSSFVAAGLLECE